ncbi:MAG TPA: epoxide hydrolase [Amnibacterium sp.]|jgi:pimeloyl-ACP methyl ester carboxylesterase|uniref:epoxide hydrolase family protein n=1 Tax=Amnibacterium sp. TaxID=1872496 RepID=UPI002F95DAFD
MTSKPFRFSVQDDELQDLRDRIRRTRWPKTWPAPAWEAGTDRRELEHLARYWADGFDWRRQERLIAALPSFMTDLGGESVHYLLFESERPGALPIVLTHGWPSSVLELVPLAQRLARPSEFGGRPQDAFTVVVPSLPGFGFSPQASTVPAAVPTHEQWHRLMRDELGFARYGVHGGDLGAGISTRLAAGWPDEVVGAHVLAVADPEGVDPGSMTEEETAYLHSVRTWFEQEGAYEHQQQTRPITLAYGLTDSPVGLLAWLLEKYRNWSDSHGDVTQAFPPDFLLTQASIYWFTNSIGTSFRPYYEYAQGALGSIGPVAVPTAVAVFPRDLVQPPRSWAERSYNLRRYTRMPRGGHFAAIEVPDLLADDIRTFFHDLA